MSRFPVTDLLSEQKYYYFLLNMLHPQGWCRPYGHPLPASQRPYMRDRAPVLDYCCRDCG